MRPIEDVARAAGIDPADFIPYGRDKAKISISAIARAEGRPEAPLVLVSAITPTPAGEGKSTTTVGLGQALNRLGKRAIIAASRLCAAVIAGKSPVKWRLMSSIGTTCE